MLKNAKVWIENNPNTGINRPWEVYFQVEGHPIRFISSCTSEAAAHKSAEKLIKRCSDMYNASLA